MLHDESGLPHISSDDILRGEVKNNTEFGKKIKAYMDRGEIGPADMIAEVVLAHIGKQCPHGFILDGFPRALIQAEMLGMAHSLNAVILLDVPENAILQRITGRRTCSACSRIYHVAVNPPRKEGICDECGGELFHRSDDNAETVKNRIRVYADDTKPLIEYYEKKGLLRRIDGSCDTQSIYRNVAAVLGKNSA